MALFQYRAVQSDGTVAEGRIEAGGRQEAFGALQGRGLNPVSLAETANGQAAERGGLRLQWKWKSKRIPFRAMEAFTRQLSSLLAAGVPLSRALKILCKEASSAAAAEKWNEIHDLVADGASLADAMAQSPGIFPQVYTAMVRAGETGGFLDVVLGQIADFQVRDKELRSKVLSALIYPAVLLVLAIAVLIFLLTFFIPRFQAIFADFGAALPTLTLCIITASKIVTKYGVFVVAAIFTAVILVRKWLQTEQGRRKWQRVLLRLPVIGPLHARFAMARFCRMLGTLIGAGVPLIASLRVARESL
ncbi:type II secretion system F family protein, partial [Candidatus Sumerlaeota bacterium]|nr:type II secretion system F family protein [Candidatus Sumerlaeota bacterium]